MLQKPFRQPCKRQDNEEKPQQLSEPAPDETNIQVGNGFTSVDLEASRQQIMEQETINVVEALYRSKADVPPEGIPLSADGIVIGRYPLCMQETFHGYTCAATDGADRPS